MSTFPPWLSQVPLHGLRFDVFLCTRVLWKMGVVSEGFGGGAGGSWAGGISFQGGVLLGLPCRLESAAAAAHPGCVSISAEQIAVGAGPHAHAGAGHSDRAAGQGADERPALPEDRAPGGGPACAPPAAPPAPVHSGGPAGQGAFAEDQNSAGTKAFLPRRSFGVWL